MTRVQPVLRFTFLAVLVAAAAHAAQTATARPQPAVPAKPDCTVSDVRATATPPPASKLSVETRRSIFVDLQQAVARAQADASKSYPTAEGGALMSPTNVEKDTKLSRKRDTAALSFERTYVAEILKQRALTCAAARDIVREGRDAKWPSSK